MKKRRTFIKRTLALSVGAVSVPSFILSSSCQPKSSSQGQTSFSNEGLAHYPFELPKLPYGFSDLTSAIDAETMEIHYTKHHQGYVNKLNTAIEKEGLKEDSLETLFSREDLPLAIRNNGGGHYNHSLFWQSLKAGGSVPPQHFLLHINKYFGSLEGLQSSLIEGGKSVFGSGWVWLIKEKTGSLAVITTPNQDNSLMKIVSFDGIPLLGIDVWEHAYYIRYQNKRSEYLANIMSIIDWEKVALRA